MDVYSQQEQRAHGTGFVGIEAESDDAIDTLEVYEALINPRESERGAGGQGGGMMPPMMGMGGGGASSGASTGAQPGLAAASRMGTTTAPVVSGGGVVGIVPTAGGPAAASAGVGSGATLGGLGGGGALPAMPSGPAAAGLAEEEPEAPEAEVPEIPAVEPGAVPVPEVGALVEQQPPVVDEPTNPGVTSIDPAQVEKAAREWSSLAGEMAEISATAGQLQASLEDFGLVQQPAGPYGEVSSGIRELAGGASREFDQIASGLTYGARAYRDQEAQAAQSVRSVQ